MHTRAHAHVHVHTQQPLRTLRQGASKGSLPGPHQGHALEARGLQERVAGGAGLPAPLGLRGRWRVPACLLFRPGSTHEGVEGVTVCAAACATRGWGRGSRRWPSRAHQECAWATGGCGKGRGHGVFECFPCGYAQWRVWLYVHMCVLALNRDSRVLSSRKLTQSTHTHMSVLVRFVWFRPSAHVLASACRWWTCLAAGCQSARWGTAASQSWWQMERQGSYFRRHRSWRNTWLPCCTALTRRCAWLWLVHLHLFRLRWSALKLHFCLMRVLLI